MKFNTRILIQTIPFLAGFLTLTFVANAQDIPQRGREGTAERSRTRGRGGFSFGRIDPNATLATQIIRQGDQDDDQRISNAEFATLVDAWFGKLDVEKIGKLNQADFTERFRALMVSEAQSDAGSRDGSGGRAPGGRRGFGGFNPFANVGLGMFLAADLNKDGALVSDELRDSFGAWFNTWDSEEAGSLDETNVLAGLVKTFPQPSFGGRFGRGRRGASGRGGVLESEEALGADFSVKPPVEVLSPEEEAKRFLLPDGYRMELVLSEPDIQEPVAIAFDGNGRMFVAEMRTYMQNIDGSNEHDPVSRVSMHEDTNGDGNYNRHTVFIDKMVLPRFVLPWTGNSILSMETDGDDIFKFTDTDGDGVSDEKELFYNGGGRRGNLEHQQSGMIWALDNWIYTTYNAFRLRWTPGGVIRENTAPNGGQWGLTQDDYGKVWFVDAGGERGPINFQTPILYGAFNVSDQFEEGFIVPWPAPGGLSDMQGGNAACADA